MTPTRKSTSDKPKNTLPTKFGNVSHVRTVTKRKKLRRLLRKAGNLTMVIQGKTDYEGKQMCHAIFKENDESVDYYFTEDEGYLVIEGEEFKV